MNIYPSIHTAFVNIMFVWIVRKGSIQFLSLWSLDVLLDFTVFQVVSVIVLQNIP